MTNITPVSCGFAARPFSADPAVDMATLSAGTAANQTGQRVRVNADAAASGTQSTAQTRLAPGAIAARDMTKVSSRSLNPQEKKLARAALENAKVRLDRTELALQGNWLKRVPGTNLTNKEMFRQYFGNNTETMRVEVLTRLQRVRSKVESMLKQDIGNTVVRATGALSGYSAFVQPSSGKETVYLGDRFFSFRSPSPVSMNSQAGVFVHELFHLVQYNGKKGVDDVPGYVGGDKGVYSEQALKKLADTSPELAVRNNNLFMWYVEREK